MSIERQPGRPSREEFIDAATRLVRDSYEPEVRLIYTQYGGWGAATVPASLQKSQDMGVAQREYRADGIVPGRSLTDFVFYQLGLYSNDAKNNHQ